MGWIDDFEFPEYPKYPSVGEMVGNTIAAPDTQIDLGVYTPDRARPPPPFQVSRLGPSFE
jgi:hypothetical protein